MLFAQPPLRPLNLLLWPGRDCGHVVVIKAPDSRLRAKGSGCQFAIPANKTAMLPLLSEWLSSGIGHSSNGNNLRCAVGHVYYIGISRNWSWPRGVVYLFLLFAFMRVWLAASDCRAISHAHAPPMRHLYSLWQHPNMCRTCSRRGQVESKPNQNQNQTRTEANRTTCQEMSTTRMKIPRIHTLCKVLPFGHWLPHGYTLKIYLLF